MGEMIDVADYYNLEPQKIDEAKLTAMFGGVKNLASKVWALREAIKEQASTVNNLMQKVRDTDSDEAVIEYAKEKNRFLMMYSVLSSVTTESGRSTGMGFRNMEGWDDAAALRENLQGKTGRTLFQLKMEAKLGTALDTPGKVAKFLREANSRSGGGMLLESWVNSLISGPWTHITYAQGNALLTVWQAVPETAAAAGIAAVRGRVGERVRIGEVGAQLAAIGRSVPAALQAGGEGFRTGMTTLLPGEKARPLTPYAGTANLTIARATTNAPVSWSEVGADLYAALNSGRHALLAGAALVQAGGHAGAPLLGWHYSRLGQFPDIAVRGVPAIPIGSLIRMPGRFIAAIHSFFRLMNYSRLKAADAYRTAANDPAVQTPAQFAARASGVLISPTAEQMATYRLGATESTLMGEGGAWVKNLSKFVNTTVNVPGLGATPILKFVMPFVHIASNVIDQSIVRRTPAGLLSAELRRDLLGHNGPINQDTAQARMLVGTALIAGYGFLKAQGYLTGSGPSDRNQAAVWRTANQPHSVRIGDIWYQTNHLGPLGMHLGMAADLYDVAHEATEGEFLKAAAMLHHAVVQNVLDESFMRGPADLLKAIEDPGRYGENYLKSMISSFVPFSVGLYQAARAADPYSRQARTVLDTIRQKIPGMSEDLMPRRDVWGEELPNPHGLGYVSAVWEKKVSTDPVNLALSDLGIGIAPPERKIRNGDLTDQEYDDFARIAGRMTKTHLDKIVRSEMWNRSSNGRKHDIVKVVLDGNREAARGYVMVKYPHIPRDAAQVKREHAEQ